MPHDMGDELRDLFKRVKGQFVCVRVLVIYPVLVTAGYAVYVDLVGGAIGMGACAALRRGNKIFTIDERTPLVHFLSDSEVSY